MAALMEKGGTTMWNERLRKLWSPGFGCASAQSYEGLSARCPPSGHHISILYGYTISPGLRAVSVWPAHGPTDVFCEDGDSDRTGTTTVKQAD